MFAGSDEWPAGPVPDLPETGSSYHDCLAGELSEVLGAALAWHDQNPGERPEVDFPDEGTYSPCQTSVHDLTVTIIDEVEESDPCPEVGAPRIAITVSVPGGSDPEPAVDGLEACWDDVSQGVGFRTAVVYVPALADDPPGELVVQSDYGELSVGIDVPDSGGSGSTEATAEPTAPEASHESTEPAETSEPTVTESP